MQTRGDIEWSDRPLCYKEIALPSHKGAIARIKRLTVFDIERIIQINTYEKSLRLSCRLSFVNSRVTFPFGDLRTKDMGRSALVLIQKEMFSYGQKAATSERASNKKLNLKGFIVEALTHGLTFDELSVLPYEYCVSVLDLKAYYRDCEFYHRERCSLGSTKRKVLSYPRITDDECEVIDIDFKEATKLWTMMRNPRG